MTNATDKDTARTCVWSNETSTRVKEITVETVDRTGGNPHEDTVYVLPEHEEDLRTHLADVRRNGRTMLILVAVLTATMLVSALGGPLAGLDEETTLTAVGVQIVLLGGVILRFPFSTPETVDMLGIARSRSVTRILGVVTIVLGVWMSV